jgi:hypothetical protein
MGLERRESPWLKSQLNNVKLCFRRRLKMRFLKFLIVLIFFCSSVTLKSEEVLAETISKAGLAISGSIDSYSQYVWRGFLLDSDPVIQPGVGVGFSGLTLSLWCSFDAAGDDASMSSEVDYAIDYTFETEILSFSIGNTYYTFPEYDLKSMEAYLGIGIAVLASPSLTIFYDYGDEAEGGADGVYASLDLSHSQPILLDITFDIGAHVGYNYEAFILGNGYDIALSGGLSLQLFDGLTLAPNVIYSVPFSDLKEETDGNQESELYFGASLGWDF